MAAASMPRTLPQPDPPRLRRFSAICRKYSWEFLSISDRCVDQRRHPPTAARKLSKAGRCGLAGPLAPWMAPSSPQGWVYGVSCQPTPPRHPTECPLLLLLLRLPASGRHYRGCRAASPAEQPYFRGR
ncbi:hypothetical protein VO93_09820 [Stenotrophomonas maltophilia]|nr:hypothetical protein VO93_09820 [Stenotrophomonas maltophilia]